MSMIPIRQEIEVLPADPLPQLKVHEYLIIPPNGGKLQKSRFGSLGWTVKEIIGIGIINPRGISNGKKSTKII